MPRLRRIRVLMTGGALACALLVFGPGASAQAAPYEPNDTVAQAIGPLNGGQDYNAGIETSNDEDYYYFNVVGQRQLDISAAEVSGYCDGLSLLDPDGDRVTSTDMSSTTTSHLRYTTSGNAQYVLHATGDSGCAYKFRIDPADAITPTSPGVVVTLNALEGSDDSERILLDGKEVGTLTGSTGPTVVSLGILPATAKLQFEARNQTGGWSWNVTVTNQDSRTLVTTFSEKQSSSYSDNPRIGVVRRVTMSPSGGLLDSCGEALAPTICDPPLPVVDPTPKPTGPSKACKTARSRRASSAARVAVTRRALSRARRRSTRRRLSRRLAAQRRELSQRTSVMRSACAV